MVDPLEDLFDFLRGLGGVELANPVMFNTCPEWTPRDKADGKAPTSSLLTYRRQDYLKLGDRLHMHIHRMSRVRGKDIGDFQFQKNYIWNWLGTRLNVSLTRGWTT